MKKNISSTIYDALRYPFTDIRRFLILYLLNLGAFLIIPVILANGYLIKIIRFTIDGSNVLPDFNGSDELIGDGLRYIVVNIIYQIPSYIIIFYFLLSNPVTSSLAIFSTPTTAILLIIVSFLVNIPFFIGLANMAYLRHFKEAFAFNDIIKLIGTIGWSTYLVYLVIMTIIGFILNFASGLTTGTTILLNGNVFEALLVFFIIFTLANVYIRVFDARLRGLIYPKDIVEPYIKDESIKTGATSAAINRKLKARREQLK